MGGAVDLSCNLAPQRNVPWLLADNLLLRDARLGGVLGERACLTSPTSYAQSHFDACLSSQPGASQEQGSSSASRSEGGSRPSRGGSVFDDPEEESDAGAAAQDGADAPAATTAAASDGASDAPAEVEPEESGPAPSAEWQAASPGIAADMRAHLKRREKKAEADLIRKNRGPITSVLFGVGDFLRSRYFKNVRKSLGIFMGAWFWYVLNTKCDARGSNPCSSQRKPRDKLSVLTIDLHCNRTYIPPEVDD